MGKHQVTVSDPLSERTWTLNDEEYRALKNVVAGGPGWEERLAELRAEAKEDRDNNPLSNPSYPYGETVLLNGHHYPLLDTSGSPASTPTGPWYGGHETVCEEAQRLTTGGRNRDYGHPLDDYTRTAELWTALLRHKLGEGQEITYQDAIRCMVAVKLSRDTNLSKRDNKVDIAGYANCLQFAQEEMERRNGA